MLTNNSQDYEIITKDKKPFEKIHTNELYYGQIMN